MESPVTTNTVVVIDASLLLEPSDKTYEVLEPGDPRYYDCRVKERFLTDEEKNSLSLRDRSHLYRAAYRSVQKYRYRPGALELLTDLVQQNCSIAITSLKSSISAPKGEYHALCCEWKDSQSSVDNDEIELIHQSMREKKERIADTVPLRNSYPKGLEFLSNCVDPKGVCKDLTNQDERFGTIHFLKNGFSAGSLNKGDAAVVWLLPEYTSASYSMPENGVLHSSKEIQYGDSSASVKTYMNHCPKQKNVKRDIVCCKIDLEKNPNAMNRVLELIKQAGVEYARMQDKNVREEILREPKARARAERNRGQKEWVLRKVVLPVGCIAVVGGLVGAFSGCILCTAPALFGRSTPTVTANSGMEKTLEAPTAPAAPSLEYICPPTAVGSVQAKGRPAPSSDSRTNEK